MGFHQIWGAKQEYLRNIRFGFARIKQKNRTILYFLYRAVLETQNAKRISKFVSKTKLICLSCFSFKMGDIEVMVAVVEVSVVAVFVTVAAIIADSLHGKH